MHISPTLFWEDDCDEQANAMQDLSTLIVSTFFYFLLNGEVVNCVNYFWNQQRSKPSNLSNYAESVTSQVLVT